MNQRFLKMVCVLTLGCFSVVQLSGCAAGNFGLTRSLAGWNNKFSIFPKVLVYIGLFILQIYTLTLLFDFIINNTVEFWSGHAVISQNQTFEKEGKRYVIQHTRDPLRKTVVTVYGKDGKVEAVNELRETVRGTVEVYVNSEMKAELDSVSDALVQISTQDGRKTDFVHVQPTEHYDKKVVKAAMAPFAVTR